MSDKENLIGPVVVGGLGGSGTRVIADILVKLGFFMGRDLNSAFDNLWFTLIFKRPRWFIKNSAKKKSIDKALSVFEKSMFGCLKPWPHNFALIVQAAIEQEYFSEWNQFGKRQSAWPIAKRMLSASNSDGLVHYKGWGWKEPNSHIYIEFLAKYFPNLKYIHLIRHGLDMAYSANQSQLYNWGSLFGMQLPITSSLLPKASLSYWIKANHRAINLGKRYLGDRFLAINFDKLCHSPYPELIRLITFLEINTNEVEMDQLICVPKKPKSTGRYKQNDISIFNQTDFDEVRKLGFEVD